MQYQWVSLRGNPTNCKHPRRSFQRMQKKLEKEWPGWEPVAYVAPVWATHTDLLLKKESEGEK